MYHPKAEGYYIRRHLYKLPGVLYCGGCTWTRTSRQPILAITSHFSQQTLLEPLTMSGALASSVLVNDIGMYCTRIYMKTAILKQIQTAVQEYVVRK